MALHFPRGSADQDSGDNNHHVAGKTCVWGPADQDSVRLLAVEGCGPLARLLNRDDTMLCIIPVVKKFSAVRSLLFWADRKCPDVANIICS
jgi:hypothetical protein